MKKLLVLACLLVVGLNVGCGDKPKMVAPTGKSSPIDKMAEEGKKKADENAKEPAK